MSDAPEEYVRAAVARDSRFRDLQNALAVENDIENNQTVKMLLSAFRADADLAMLELVETSPVDAKAISLISVRVGVYVKTKRILETVLTRGKIAEQLLREDHRGNE